MSVAWYVGDVAVIDNMVACDGGEEFVTARAIKKGEELTADYGAYHEYVKVFAKKQKRPGAR